MVCREEIQLTAWKLCLIISFCIISVIVGLYGIMRHVEPMEYDHPTTKMRMNKVSAVVHTHSKSMPFLDDIGAPPNLNDRNSYVEWTFLQMNDVYEMKPLAAGQKGGLARVATIRKLLLEENRQTFTVIAGDIVSPSALGNSVVNGSMLEGKQMIATLNTLGVDFATLGNHEFDLKETSLRQRLDESKFTWIASNVFERNSNKPFHNVIPYKIITVSQVRILLIGLTIDDNLGPVPTDPYVNITSQETISQYTAEFIAYLRHDLQLQWDVLICLTHLNMHNDIQLVEHNLPIDVVLGGHEHENYFLKRGSKYTPIYKADDNAFTVFIHRFAYQPIKKQLLISSTLTRVSPRFPDEPETAKVANYYYDVGLKAYREQGFLPDRVICELPEGLILDGRSANIRASQTHLTRALCESMMFATNTNVSIINSGAIRIDDQLMGIITEYDILRCLPFPADLITIKTTGAALVKALTRGSTLVNTGMYLSYAGIIYNPKEEKWSLQSNGQALDDENLELEVSTIPYCHTNSLLKQSSIISKTHSKITRAFIDYLERIYKKNRHRKSSHSI